MYIFSKKHLILFISTFSISLFLIIFQIFEREYMLAWVSLSISLVFFTISNLIFNKKKLHLFILYLYHYMFVCSIFVKPEYLYRNIIVQDYVPFLLLPTLCYLIIIPFVFIKRVDLNFLINNRKIDIIIVILFPFIIFSFLYLLPHTLNTFIYGAESIRLGGVNNSEYFTLPKNFLTTIAVGVALFYPLYLFFLFQQVVSNGKFFLKIILILGLITGMLGGLVFAGRDRFIFIFFYLILFYWCWYPYLNNYLKSKVNKFIKISVLICTSFFLWITFDRFEESLIESSLFYYGAQPYIFSEIYSENLIHDLSYIFPIFFDGKELIDRVDPVYWMWGTLYQNLYFSGGLLFCVFFALFNNIFSSLFFNYFYGLNYLYISFLIIYFHIVSTGVFYYHLGFPGGNNYIVGIILFGILMYLLHKVSVKNG